MSKVLEVFFEHVGWRCRFSLDVLPLIAKHRVILRAPKMAIERAIDVFSHHTEATDDPRITGLDDGRDPFVAAVRATRMPMVITDPRQPDNPIVFVNDSFCRLSGYERAEILGRNCRFLQGPDTDPEALRLIREAVREKRSVQVDLRNYRKNGEPFWNRLLLGPVNGADGEPAYFFASQVDVTLERERMTGLEIANAALIAELADRVRAVEMGEARLLAATAAADLGIWHLDLSTQELYASQHCKLNFGRSAHVPFSYQELLEAVHPDDRQRMREAVAQTIETGDDYRIEYRIVRPDGQLAWVRIQARLERSAEGQPLQLAGVSQDVTQEIMGRRRAELLQTLDREVYGVHEDPNEIAYRAMEALGRVLDVSRAGYGTIDKRAETITIERDWNAPGIRTLAGTLKFREHGSYIDNLKRGETVVFADARLDPRTCDYADALIAINAQSAINMPVSEDGDFVALLYLNHATARPWTTEELDLVREVAHRTRQAVERRRAEQDLRDLAASLERQVQERTAELMKTEATLRQSQKMEAVGQLTGGLAHDFNNLLGAISGSLELLKRKTQGDATIDRYVDIGQTATKRAAALTHRLLAFSRQQTLEPKVISVNRLIGDFEVLIRRTIGPEISLEAVTGIDIWPVSVDPSQLENAVLNLCINARDAMPDGGRLVVETANRSLDEHTAGALQLLPGQYVSVCVSDNGTGMPADVIARAFDPFFTTKPIGVGTGLGLSMVYGFTRQSGGHARIYSEEGSGTNVCMYLPRHHGEVDAAENNADQAQLPAIKHAGETVLVVDDEASVRTLMAEVLSELGYRVLEAEDGPAAIQILQANRFVKLLVTDVGLPGGMNGRQVADAARLLIQELQVLFVTGYAENAALSHGHLPLGMQVLTKPFELSAFGQRVQTLVSATKTSDAS
ncbi:PAS domain-containing protein [Variovorax sp. RHLX14]|uniref:PAS domain-containing protein n=1 Tax=Variovorax sp. RHLX14 TaxID=1259731 RepID=UPI003F48BCF9